MQQQRYRLTSASPMFFGAPVSDAKPNDITHDDWERTIWKKKVHQTPDGQAYVQPFALKNALESAGSRLNMKLTGKATYTKLFRQGLIVVDPLLLSDPKTGNPLRIDDGINLRMLYVPSDGKRGGPKRVWRSFPETVAWTADATITILDARLKPDIVLKHLEEAGLYIGFGSMRVENGGITGRFMVEAI